MKWEDNFSSEAATHISHAISCNTSDSTNATDRATLEFVERFGVDIVATRMKHLPK